MFGFAKGLARQDVDSLQSKQHGIITQMSVKLPVETLIPVNGDANLTFIFLLGGTKKNPKTVNLQLRGVSSCLNSRGCMLIHCSSEEKYLSLLFSYRGLATEKPSASILRQRIPIRYRTPQRRGYLFPDRFQLLEPQD